MKGKKNILFIANSLHFGGAEKHVVSLLNGLNDKKFNQFLCCLKDDKSLLPQIQKDRVKDICFLHVSHKLDLNSIRKLANYIYNKKIDIVVCINQYPMIYGLLAEKIARKSAKVIVIFHRTLIYKFKDRLQLLLYRFFFKRCDCVVFVSKNQGKYWLNEKHLKTKKTVVIQNGIDCNYFDFKLNGDQRRQLLQQLNFSNIDYIVGLCGTLRHEKFHIDGIEAIEKVRKKGLNVKFLIIGDGPERERIEQHISKKGLENVVAITGFQEDVRPFIVLCSCMIITSHSETFSIAALESMNMGKPMIMTDIGGASEQIEHGKTGFLYQKGDIESLANYILKLSSQVLRKQMGSEALKSVRKSYSLEKMLNNYEELFQVL